MRVGGKYIYICISDKAATGFSHKNIKSKMVHDKGADVNLKNSLWCYFMGSLMLQKLRVTVRVLDRIHLTEKNVESNGITSIKSKSIPWEKRLKKYHAINEGTFVSL